MNSNDQEFVAALAEQAVKGKRGRKAKADADKRSIKIGIAFTPGEFAAAFPGIEPTDKLAANKRIRDLLAKNEGTPAK